MEQKKCELISYFHITIHWFSCPKNTVNQQFISEFQIYSFLLSFKNTVNQSFISCIQIFLLLIIQNTPAINLVLSNLLFIYHQNTINKKNTVNQHFISNLEIFFVVVIRGNIFNIAYHLSIQSINLITSKNKNSSTNKNRNRGNPACFFSNACKSYV